MIGPCKDRVYQTDYIYRVDEGRDFRASPAVLLHLSPVRRLIPGGKAHHVPKENLGIAWLRLNRVL